MKDQDRLSQIETLWSMVLNAHAQSGADQARAQQQLLVRYGVAIQRYLLGALRDTTAAEDAYQEFAVKFLRGDFRQAAPDKGRFRGFLKVVLSRLVADHFRARQRRPVTRLDSTYQVPDESMTEQWDRDFQTAWRDQMLTEAWKRLGAEEQETGKPWMTILRLRVENPQCRSSELASGLSKLVGEPITPARVRVLLHRSRERFANYLIEAVADTLPADSPDDIEQELSELELLEYCQGALERRKRKPRP